VEFREALLWAEDAADLEDQLGQDDDTIGFSSENSTDNYSEIVGVEPTGFERRLVDCKFCGNEVDADTAHVHGKGWVGDDCCWDERLRATE